MENASSPRHHRALPGRVSLQAQQVHQWPQVLIVARAALEAHQKRANGRSNGQVVTFAMAVKSWEAFSKAFIFQPDIHPKRGRPAISNSHRRDSLIQWQEAAQGFPVRALQVSSHRSKTCMLTDPGCQDDWQLTCKLCRSFRSRQMFWIARSLTPSPP